MRVVLLLFSCVLSSSFAVRFSVCELVYELRTQGFPEYLMKDLICLVKETSSFRSHVIGGPHPDGSYDFGLFQINDRLWCNNGPSPGKACNVRCTDLLLDDITIAASCAKTILRQQGFSAWMSWVNFCHGYRLPELDC